MTEEAAAKLFRGTVPDAYEQLMVPLQFQPYADDMAERAVARHPGAVLELAAGTGVVTRALARALPAETTLVVTDLNPEMLAVAQRVGIDRPAGASPVVWEPADAQELRFADRSFDLAICQFGVMFFPDRRRSHAEVRRVLRPGGAYVFTVWDSVATNAVAAAVDAAYRREFPGAPPNVITRVAHGYHDVDLIRRDAEAAGLEVESIEPVDRIGRAPSAVVAVTAITRGTPLRADLESRGPVVRDRVERAAAELLIGGVGTGSIETPLRAYAVSAVRNG